MELIDTYSPEAIIAAVNALIDERQDDVTVSTAHKANCLEWSKFKIADDFPPPSDSGHLDNLGRPILKPVSEADACLTYIAVTCARHHLDLSRLEWIENRQIAPH